MTPGKRARQPVAIELHVLGRLGIAGQRRRGDLGGAERAAGALLELPLQAGSAQPGFDAALAAAVAARAGPLVVARRRQRIVAPFAGDRLRAGERPAVDHHAAAHAGAQDDAEYDAAAGRCAVARLGDGKAIGVVGQPHLAAQPALEVGPQRPAVQPRRVGVLDQAGGGRDRAGMGDADRAARAGLAFEAGDEVDDRLDVLFIGTWPASARAGARARRRRLSSTSPSIFVPPRSMPIRMRPVRRKRERMLPSSLCNRKTAGRRHYGQAAGRRERGESARRPFCGCSRSASSSPGAWSITPSRCSSCR